MSNEIKVEFAPGCFDEFEGTQDELAELIAEIHRLADSGELFDQATCLEDDDEDALAIMAAMAGQDRPLLN